MGTMSQTHQMRPLPKHTETGQAAGCPGGEPTLHFSVSTAQGDRESQEDTHVMRAEVPHRGRGRLSFFAVFDGHGGGHVSQQCSAMLLDNCLEKIENSSLQSLTDGLRHGCFKMDQTLRACHHLQSSTCGSTGIMAFFTGDSYVVANVGDSRSILVRRPQSILGKNGSHSVIPLSFDHKPNNPQEIARIGNAGGFVETTTHSYGGREFQCSRVDGRLAVARAFGDFDLKTSNNLPAELQKVSCEPEIISEQALERDLLVLACDGIWDVMSNEDVGEFVVDAMQALDGDVETVAEVLVERAYALGSTDNMTAMVIAVGK